ncbi:UPF0182 family membrane protein [Cellulomonas uda]|uniref:UPF0182 protein CUD01_06530 n=1 Tax=Cellulomonas uda TaxID=1714 RepID=A0A4Y3K6T1_CELUD|nr:UPF0182 family protein [Cellulomonas uda]NII65162.1 hypothetical protein [Cellulomonas uda]GEA80209.1 UPF0182 protein [Cellulomonas uda]
MSFASTPRNPSAGRPAGRPSERRRGALVPTLIVLGAIVVLVLILAQVWTEWLWFDQLGFIEVLRTEWGTRAVLFVVGFLAMAVAVGLTMRYAYRSRPVYAPSTPEQASLDQYREAIEPLRRLVMIVAPALLGLFAGAAVSQRWDTVQLWMHAQHVGTADPQYGIDLGFYLFVLPGIRFVVSFLIAVTVLSGVAALATQYLYGGLRIGGSNDMPRTTRAARIQLSVIAAVLMLLVAANYWLDRYSILTKTAEKFDGAAYTDVHAVIPSKAILAGIAVFVAVTFVVTAVRGNWRMPLIGVGLMVVAAIAVGGIYPAVVQRFQVQPNQQDAEAEYIKRNIEATRDAYGIEDVDVKEYDAKVTAEPQALRDDAETAASIRLLDPQVVSPSFKQLQQVTTFYSFPDTLSVDRYEIDGESQDTVIAARELNLSGLEASQRNWTNDVTVYTHGYGVVAAAGNRTAARGAPSFLESGIPSKGVLGEYEPRIYFSPGSPQYSIVGGPEGSDWELDRPTNDGGGSVNTRFPTQDVSAGPSVGNAWNKLLYAVKFGSEQILFSDRVNEQSQILYDRSPRDRVEKVAPYLTLDGRVYPAVVDGRVVWIVDGYTTSSQYPYAAQVTLDDATVDSLTQSSQTVQALQPKTANYIRNSVKATVDAYDGTVTLYAWDDEDPILRAWQEIFPTSLQPLSEIEGELMAHLRYPEDLFKVQRELLARYHVSDPKQFFTGTDFWAVPDDPNTAGNVAQPPYYMTLRMPEEKSASFSLTSTFIPFGQQARNVMRGYIAVDADAGSQDGTKAPGYGKIRLLELPRDGSVPGPGQVNNNMTTDSKVAEEFTLLGRGGANIVRANLLALPVGDGMLYVQPVYLQAEKGTTFPLLQRVIVAFGDEVAISETLDGALNDVFDGDSGVETDPGAPPAGENPGTGGETPEEPTTPQEPGDADAEARADLADALERARVAIQEGQAALAEGDFAAYGESQDALDQAIADALDAEARLEGGTAVTPTQSATPAPTATAGS